MEFVQPIKDKKKIEEMKTYLKSKSLRDWALFTLGVNSALRISDILALNVDDVMDEKGRIRERIKVKEIKTKKSKSFPFTPKVKEAFLTYIKQEQPKHALFPSQKGGYLVSITRFHALAILKEAAKAVGIKDNIGTHSLRKTWAFQAYMKGVPLIEIMYALNHSSEAMTLRYLGLTQSSLDKVFMEMDL